MKKILFFSNNKNKILEISRLFSSENINILSLNDFIKIKSPMEIGESFEKNAKIKSLYGLINFKVICFADDSGLCIKSMKGKPGVHSKEFLSSDQNQKNIFNKIINTCKRSGDFNAYFQTTICLSLNKNDHIFFTGRIEGKISEKIKGYGGFGYDSIFIPHNHKETFAEMETSKKNEISHRALAILKLKKYLNLI